MSKFDKHIRTSINKDILSPFGITAKVQRKSVWGDEYLDKLMVKDKRKTNTSTSTLQVFTHTLQIESSQITKQIQISSTMKT